MTVPVDGPLPRIRRAHPQESDAISALVHRSKGHWGYDASFMERVANEMVISRDSIRTHDVWVPEDETGRLVGVHRLVHGAAGDAAFLDDLFIDPSAIGTGHGRRLLEHALGLARSLGAPAVELDADPHAVGFYERMGFRRVGDTPSKLIPGRLLPRMRRDLVGAA
jgi:GNAT superfamily N-acetyltransferase